MASEVSGKFIVPACNTGAGEGTGEALSGLARAFFFAGAPTLLVSHWSVEDRATQALITRVFEQYAKNPLMSRAEALRQGMLALMAQAQGAQAYLAHPFASASFFLVGEGREAQAAPVAKPSAPTPGKSAKD